VRLDPVDERREGREQLSVEQRAPEAVEWMGNADEAALSANLGDRLRRWEVALNVLTSWPTMTVNSGAAVRAMSRAAMAPSIRS
jgi:hypothetical protein